MNNLIMMLGSARKQVLFKNVKFINLCLETTIGMSNDSSLHEFLDADLTWKMLSKKCLFVYACVHAVYLFTVFGSHSADIGLQS